MHRLIAVCVSALMLVVGLPAFAQSPMIQFTSAKGCPDTADDTGALVARQISVANTSGTTAALRNFGVYIPSNTGPNERLPMVVWMHGGAGSACEAIATAGDKWRQVAEGSGYGGNNQKFIVVYPEGKGYTETVENQTPDDADHSWNDCRNDFSSGEPGYTDWNDVNFLTQMIGEVDGMVMSGLANGSSLDGDNVDNQRVYFAGGSNGSLMALRMGFEKSAQVAAIGVNAGQLPQVPEPVTACTDGPPRRLPVIFIKGLLDPKMPQAGGQVKGSDNTATDGARGTLRSMASTINLSFVPLNGTTSTTPYSLPNIASGDGAPSVNPYAITITPNQACVSSNGDSVPDVIDYSIGTYVYIRYIAIACAGHGTPFVGATQSSNVTGTPPLPASKARQTSGWRNTDFDGAAEMWRFFNTGYAGAPHRRTGIPS